MFSPAESAKDDFRENVNMLTEQLPATITSLTAYMDTSVYQIQNWIESSHILSRKTIRVSGSEIGTLLFTSLQQGRNLQTLQYYFFSGKTGYVLTYTAVQEKFEQYYAAATAILNSFQLNHSD